MLWQYVLGVSRSWLIAHDTDSLSFQSVQAYNALEQRRLNGEPMAYIIGSREFMGRRFIVTPDVLIPRPETELLVETAGHSLLTIALQTKRALRLVDLGTGSGAIAISLAVFLADKGVRNVEVLATDVSHAAFDVARKNAEEHKANIEFFCGSWYDALPQGLDFDLIVSNPPYIASSDQHLRQGDLRFEPLVALTDEADGLQAIRVIVEGSRSRLRAPGALLLEHGWNQAQAVHQILAQSGLKRIRNYRDLAGMPRVTGAYI